MFGPNEYGSLNGTRIVSDLANPREANFSFRVENFVPKARSLSNYNAEWENVRKSLELRERKFALWKFGLWPLRRN